MFGPDTSIIAYLRWTRPQIRPLRLLEIDLHGCKGGEDDRRPAGIPWNYDRGETVADGVIHAIGICFGLIGAVILIVIASHATTGRFGHDGCIQEDVA